jgi:hypothetical protein
MYKYQAVTDFPETDDSWHFLTTTTWEKWQSVQRNWLVYTQKAEKVYSSKVAGKLVQKGGDGWKHVS